MFFRNGPFTCNVYGNSTQTNQNITKPRKLFTWRQRSVTGGLLNLTFGKLIVNEPDKQECLAAMCRATSVLLHWSAYSCGVLLSYIFCGIPQMMSLPVSLIFSSCGISKDTTRGYPCGVLDDVTSCPQAHKPTSTCHSEQIRHFAC